MDFNGIPLFNVMKSKMGYISARQSVLAQNVANADTPDYLAKDVKAPDFKKLVFPTAQMLPMQTTNSMHIVTATKDGGGYAVEKRNNTYELNPMGNNVVIEEEMMTIAENQSEYNKVLGLYRKTVDMFKTAIGKPSGG